MISFQAYIQFALFPREIRQLFIDMLHKMNTVVTKHSGYKQFVESLVRLPVSLDDLFGMNENLNMESIIYEIYDIFLEFGKWELASIQEKTVGLIEFEMHSQDFNGPEVFYDFIIPLVFLSGGKNIFACTFSSITANYAFVSVEEGTGEIIELYHTGDDKKIDLFLKQQSKALPFEYFDDLYIKKRLPIEK